MALFAACGIEYQADKGMRSGSQGCGRGCGKDEDVDEAELVCWCAGA